MASRWWEFALLDTIATALLCVSFGFMLGFPHGWGWAAYPIAIVAGRFAGMSAGWFIWGRRNG